MTKRDVENAYNNLAIYAKKRSNLQSQFDNKCKEQYGFVFNEIDFSIDPMRPLKTLQDADEIIDTLDYGTDCLPFHDFNEMMNKAKTIKDAQNHPNPV